MPPMRIQRLFGFHSGRGHDDRKRTWALVWLCMCGAVHRWGDIIGGNDHCIALMPPMPSQQFVSENPRFCGGWFYLPYSILVEGFGMACCRQHQRSRFCPECGKRITLAGDMGDLLQHVEQHARRKEGELKARCKRISVSDDFKHKALKWSRWAVELRKLIEGAS